MVWLCAEVGSGSSYVTIIHLNSKSPCLKANHPWPWIGFNVLGHKEEMLTRDELNSSGINPTADYYLAILVLNIIWWELCKFNSVFRPNLVRNIFHEMKFLSLGKWGSDMKPERSRYKGLCWWHNDLFSFGCLQQHFVLQGNHPSFHDIVQT